MVAFCSASLARGMLVLDIVKSNFGFVMTRFFRLVYRYTSAQDKIYIIFVIIVPLLTLVNQFQARNGKSEAWFFILYSFGVCISIFIIWIIIRSAKRKMDLEEGGRK